MTAIWLHHSDSVTALEGLPETSIARIVWAADHIVRHVGVGRSGSFDPPERLSAVAKAIGAEAETLAHIGDALPQEVTDKAEALGLSIPNAAARYCDAIQAVAAKLATKQTALVGRKPRTTSRWLRAISISPVHSLPTSDRAASAIDIAEDLARRWQRFFQTGSVCLYLTNGPRNGASTRSSSRPGP